VLLTTEEYVKMPEDVAGLANLRSTLARYGLSIPPTVVDVGFEGNITIEVVNNSPNTIVLKRGMRFLHLVLIKAEGRAAYRGAYQGQRGVTPPKGPRKSASFSSIIFRGVAEGFDGCRQLRTYIRYTSMCASRC